MNIFLTGATGTVGRILLPELLKAGHKVVCLVRSSDSENGRQRLEKAVGKILPNIIVMDGDITQPNCGLSKSNLDMFGLLNRFSPDVVVHLAANIKMDPWKEKEIRAVNVEGTKNVLELARYFGANFHYVSTAYVVNGSSNPYEVTKAEVEELVRQSGLRYMISRISIVIADETAIIPTLALSTGYYGFFLPFWFCAENIREGHKLEKMSEVSIPVRLAVNPESRLNLIPRDWMAEMLVSITEASPNNKTLFVTHPNPPLVTDGINWTLAELGITGVQFGDTPDYSAVGGAGEQMLLERVMKLFHPYVGKIVVFDNAPLRQFLGDRYIEPPTITGEFLGKLINYASQKNFGRKAVQKET